MKTTIGPAPAGTVDELTAIRAELQPEAPAASQGAAATGTAPAPDGNPAPASLVAVDPTLEPITREQAIEMATDVWGVVFDGVEQMSPFRFSPPTREKAIAKTFPVIVKHADKLPWWYKKWKEEIDLGVFVGTLIFTCTKAYVAAKRAAAEQARVAAPRAEAPPAAVTATATEAAAG